MTKYLAGLLTYVFLVTAGSQSSRAQQTNDRPVRIIVSIAAGGATDVTARFVAQKLTEVRRSQVYVENKPGGGFIPALKDLTSAAPDGHTLMMISAANVVAQPMHKEYPFDLAKLTAITEVSNGPFILVVRKGLGVDSLSGLVAMAKANPDKLTFGSGGGTVSSLYLAAELLRLRTGVAFKNVPYRGAGPALNDLLGGHIDAMFDAMPVQIEQINAGNVIPLMVTGTQRSTAVPKVPTAKEAGAPDYDVSNYFALLGPPGMPAATVTRIRDEVAKVLAEPDVKAQFEKQGMRASGSTPEQLADLVRTDLARWSKVIKDGGIKQE
jgi:tripartite-type tricarboxylate transporter receptor subunit TctC